MVNGDDSNWIDSGSTPETYKLHVGRHTFTKEGGGLSDADNYYIVLAPTPREHSAMIRAASSAVADDRRLAEPGLVRDLGEQEVCESVAREGEQPNAGVTDVARLGGTPRGLVGEHR